MFGSDVESSGGFNHACCQASYGDGGTTSDSDEVVEGAEHSHAVGAAGQSYSRSR